MRRISTLIIACFILAFYHMAYAHPPSDIIITFDPKTKILDAVIIHNVSNPKAHFIKKVDIALNGQEITTRNFSSQDNNASQEVKCPVPEEKTGDILSVEAYCSISGKLKKEIEIIASNPVTH